MEIRGGLALGVVMLALGSIATLEAHSKSSSQKTPESERPATHREIAGVSDGAAFLVLSGNGERLAWRTAQTKQGLSLTQTLPYFPPPPSDDFWGRGAGPKPEKASPIVTNSVTGWATFYGRGYDGQCCMGCPPGQPYYSADASIAAVSWSSKYGMYYPCGQQLRIVGPAGAHIVTVQDACPGCSPNVIDLSEAANRLVCGVPEHTCRVVIEVLR